MVSPTRIPAKFQQSCEQFQYLSQLEQLTLEVAFGLAIDSTPEFRVALGAFRGALVAERTRVSSLLKDKVQAWLSDREAR